MKTAGNGGNGCGRGQASVEYLVLAAVVLMIGIVAVALLGGFEGATNDAKISQSKSYWNGAEPLRVTEWKVLSTKPDWKGEASAQVEIIVTNPTQKNAVLRKIILGSGTNFTKVYSNGVNYAGNTTNLSISLAPSEQNRIVLVQETGPALPEKYQIELELVFDSMAPMQTQAGVEPLRGKIEIVEAGNIIADSGGCDVGKVACGSGASLSCCSSSQICSADATSSMCCPQDSVNCGGSCCSGSCIGGHCVGAGSYLCGSSSCPNGQPCCNGVCGSCVDYIISRMTADSWALTTNQDTWINTTTHNNGSANSTTLTYTVVNHTYGGVTTLFANYTVAPLNAGTNTTSQTLFSCTNSVLGTHTFTAYADSKNAMPSETYEENNARTLNVVCSGNNMKDLVISRLEANSTILVIGQVATITVDTSNIGNAATGQTTVTTIQASGGNGNPLSKNIINVKKLNGYETDTDTLTFTCQASTFGVHTITATADDNDNVNEFDEANNANSSLVIECRAPDLIVSGINANSTSLAAGQSALINVTVKNVGTADAAASYAAISSSGQGNPFASNTLQPQVPVLAPGQSIVRQVNFSCNSSTLGTRAITAYADNTSAVVESNENNNANSTLTINCTAPDLIVSRLVSNSTTLAVGQNATINVTTRNIGNATAGISNTTIAASGGSGNPLWADRLLIPALAAGTEIMKQVNFSCNTTTSGTHTITATADGSADIAEGNEGNNVNNTLVITCAAAPNIQITIGTPVSPRIYVYDRSWTVGYVYENASVPITISNSGGQSQQTTTTIYHNWTSYLVNPLGSPRGIYHSVMSPTILTVPPLSTGGSNTQNSTYTCEEHSANQNFLSWINATNPIATTPSNTVNINCTWAPDLHINSISSTHAVAGITTLAPSLTVNNPAPTWLKNVLYGENMTLMASSRNNIPDGYCNTYTLKMTDMQCDNQPAPAAYYPSIEFGYPETSNAQHYASSGCSQANAICSAGNSYAGRAYACTAGYAGCHKIEIWTDRYDTTPESYNTNNKYEVRFNCTNTPTPQPDYIISELVATPQTQSVGQIVTLSVKTKNIGTIAASTASETYMQSLNNPYPYQYGYQFSIPPLGVNSEQPNTVAFTCPVAGQFIFWTSADAQNTVLGEIDETNNAVSITVNCQ